VDVAIDDGVADAAVAADVDVGKDDAGVYVGVGVDAHILGEDGVAHHRAGDDGTGAHHELMAMPVRPGSPKTNLAGGTDRARAHGPGLVIEVEDGRDAGHVHVRLEIGLQGADVAPVEAFFLFSSTKLKACIFTRPAFWAGCRGRSRGWSRAPRHPSSAREQGVGVEDVDAMEASTISGLKGERSSVDLGFSTKPITSELRATSTTPKRETSSGVMGKVARVTSAPESRCCWSMRP